MEAGSIGASGPGAGTAAPWRPRATATGEKVIKGLLAFCGLLSVRHDDGDRRSRCSGRRSASSSSSARSSSCSGPTGRRASSRPSFGVLPIVVGTLSVTLWGMLFAIPIGLGDRDLPRRVRQPASAQDGQADHRGPRRDPDGRDRLLRGDVHPARRSSSRSGRTTSSAATTPRSWRSAAGLGIGLLIVPVIASISEDAMSAVPHGLREGAYALGATKAKVAIRVVFPAALSGIVASIVLAISRAVGETMIVVLAAGSTPNLTFNPVESIQAMTALHRDDRDRRHRAGRPPTTRRSSRSAPLLFLITLVDEPALDPARPQVPAGLRVDGGLVDPPDRARPPGRRRRARHDGRDDEQPAAQGRASATTSSPACCCSRS